MTPYYDEDGITIYCGDSAKLLPSVPAFGAVITDPPYGMGHYITDTEVFSPQMLAELVAASETVCTFGYPERLVGLCVASGLVPDEWVTWWPTNAGAKGFNMGGLWKETEAVAVFGRHRFRELRERRASSVTKNYTGSTTRVERGERSDDRRLGDVWRDPSPHVGFNAGLRKHPNEKPVAVMSRLIEGVHANTVLDPFMGSGTTLIAARQLGRQAIGIEIVEEYCEIAVKRLAQQVLPLEVATGKQPEKETA